MRKTFSLDNGLIPTLDSFISIKSDVYFTPTPIYLFEVANEFLTTFGINNLLYKMSRPFGFVREGCIVSLYTLEKYPTFKYIFSFETEVWLTIVLTLLVLGVLLSISE